jgi:hypothetical protein
MIATTGSSIMSIAPPNASVLVQHEQLPGQQQHISEFSFPRLG